MIRHKPVLAFCNNAASLDILEARIEKTEEIIYDFKSMHDHVSEFLETQLFLHKEALRIRLDGCDGKYLI